MSIGFYNIYSLSLSISHGCVRVRLRVCVCVSGCRIQFHSDDSEDSVDVVVDDYIMFGLCNCVVSVHIYFCVYVFIIHVYAHICLMCATTV